MDKLPAIRGPQIELDAFRRRLMSRRHHRKPRQWIRFLAGRQAIERALEPFLSFRKLAGESLRDLGTNFIAARAN
jgi:hypothetical protein